MNRPVVVAFTGGSGPGYGRRLVQVLLELGRQVHLTISPAATQVIRHELGISIDLRNFQPLDLWPDSQPHLSRLQYFHYQDFMTPMASGSFLTDGMVICPCSGSTLAAVAHAMGENLIHRAAEVHLKERRKLVLVPRETPLSPAQLDNMKRAAEAGAIILPAMPGFYHGVKGIRDLVDFVVARICDQLGIPNQLIKRWGS